WERCALAIIGQVAITRFEIVPEYTLEKLVRYYQSPGHSRSAASGLILYLLRRPEAILHFSGVLLTDTNFKNTTAHCLDLAIYNLNCSVHHESFSRPKAGRCVAPQAMDVFTIYPQLTSNRKT
ncbi:MAG: hypothetical protein MUO43_15870, partial [Desulfobacterales bacterium]|nr:hypothetical protein [Desulfobacterales bacterium]